MSGDDEATGTAPVRRRVILTGISSRAWEHPADRGALAALRELRGFDDVLKALSGLWNERALRMEALGSAIRVDHRQYPRVYRLFAEAAATLDIAELPELYVQYDRSINGMCIGMSKPFIVINSGSLELLDDSELRCLLGHELGHLLSGHAVYRTMAMILHDWAARLSWLPVGSLALRAISAGLREWWRKAELSADRAGLLAGQDTHASLRLSMKLAGGGDLSEVDVTAFLEQAAEYDRAGDLRDSMIKIGMVLDRTHPLPVARAAELRNWIDSGEYQRILGGDYLRREDPRASSVREDVKSAADSYRETFARSQDPLVSLLRRLGDGAGDWVGTGAGRVRDWMGGGGRRRANGTQGSRTADPWSAATDPDEGQDDQPGDPR
ncbi:M48 family metallopeptidase [Planosporangium flavigriseum]|uniref:Peptidase M48 n=1 Tax=Planosporangium flavigriseum TaxID=373681 RepID=A0A8J3M017_9ACTN|nr:M48 family metallopeptidase [Planosporangium flavigriseum]NJC66761.1 M48 family metallopeptidase [Planosporangium flavigriseum]GIG76555.1 peptidase M48 [Planosporangium flavigriseum]